MFEKEREIVLTAFSTAGARAQEAGLAAFSLLVQCVCVCVAKKQRERECVCERECVRERQAILTVFHLTAFSTAGPGAQEAGLAPLQWRVCPSVTKVAHGKAVSTDRLASASA